MLCRTVTLGTPVQARIRVELVEEGSMELVSEYHTRLWDRAFVLFHLSAQRLGLLRWLRYVRKCRHADVRQASARAIQRVVRGHLGRFVSWARVLPVCFPFPPPPIPTHPCTQTPQAFLPPVHVAVAAT